MCCSPKFHLEGHVLLWILKYFANFLSISLPQKLKKAKTDGDDNHNSPF